MLLLQTYYFENNITINWSNGVFVLHQTTETFNHELNFAGDETSRDQLEAVHVLVEVLRTLVCYERADVFCHDADTC